MTNKTNTLWGQTLSVFNQHWFKIGLLALGLYAFLSRDFSFRISIQAPSEIPEEGYQSTSNSRKETLTDNSLSAPQATNHFDFIPDWGGDKKMNFFHELQKVDQTIIQNFIQRFTHVASAEEEKYGIPANIILAHAILKSSAGTSEYVKNGNNYFALACSDNWNGGTQDGHQGCIRRYDNAWQSFRDHSLFLTTGTYASLKKIDTNNHNAWAKALGQIHKENEGLNDQLLYIIEHFGL